MTNSRGNTWWIDSHAGASRWKLILLLYTGPVTALTVLVYGEPGALHIVWVTCGGAPWYARCES
jgi:hypothetical protein